MNTELQESTDLPSSHGGGVLPGDQMGLSGSAAARTANDGRAASACLSSVLPPRKDSERCPFLGSAATAVEEEEAETSAMAAKACGVGAAVWRVARAPQV